MHNNGRKIELFSLYMMYDSNEIMQNKQEHIVFILQNIKALKKGLLFPLMLHATDLVAC